MKKVFLTSIFFLWAPVALAAEVEPAILWEQFKNDYLSVDGRVIDRENADKSHSEGQGYALYLAQKFNEPETFKLVLSWSENNLGVGLKAWSWGNSGQKWQILDKNNASDGDIMHAWALLLAGEKWQNNTYTTKGLEILKELKNCCITSEGLILPGQYGFHFDYGTVINPSYYIYPAIKDFKRLDAADAKLWENVSQTGLELLSKASLSGRELPPDWLLVKPNGEVGPCPDKIKNIFGYEAIRVPLYLAGGGFKEPLNTLKPLISRAASQKYLPACVPALIKTDCQGEAGYGNYAVLSRAAEEIGMTNESNILLDICKQKKSGDKKYYDSILLLLSVIL